MALSASAFCQSAKDASDPPSKPDFPALKTKKGEVFRECYVNRVDPDGLVIRHSDGAAHVSFFDLSSEIQQQYDFDPVAALKEYKARIAAQREARKQMLLETEKVKAAQARAAAEKELYQIARKRWVPAEGRIAATRENGCFVRAKRIVMVPTKVISKLGFENEGPPERTLQNFGPGLVFLKLEDDDPIQGTKWQGYIDPVSLDTITFPPTNQTDIPVHRAVSLNE